MNAGIPLFFAVRTKFGCTVFEHQSDTIGKIKEFVFHKEMLKAGFSKQ